MKNLTSLLCGLFALFFNVSFGQTYWQQAVKYKMNVEMDVETFQYSGDQELVYTNNSPDVLKRVFYHLYFNAFQPGSEMSVRVKTGKDKNTRFKIEIDSLKKIPVKINFDTIYTDEDDKKSVVIFKIK